MKQQFQINLQFQQQVQAPSSALQSAIQISYSPNDSKIAAIRYDRQIQFYNEQLQPTELIQTRGIDHTKITDTYIPTCITWSADSQFIALGQSDNSVYIYNIGQNFEKKSIIGKCVLNAPATAIQWIANASTPQASDIVIGCSNGDCWVYNVQQKKTELIFGNQAMKRLIQQKTSAIDRVGGQVNNGTIIQSSNSAIVSIHQISTTQVLVVDQMGTAGLFDINQRTQMASVARNNTPISSSCILKLKQNQQQYLATFTCDNRLIINNLNGLAIQQIKLPTKHIITSCATVQTGGSLLGVTSDGVYIIQIIQQNPLQLKLTETFKFIKNNTKPIITVNSNCSTILISYSNGKIDSLQPSLNSTTYCNCQVVTQATNKQILMLNNFTKSKITQNQIQFENKQSTEIRKIHAYPEKEFVNKISSNSINDFNGYIASIGDKSIVVYSFQDDYLVEIEINVNIKDKLYFDIGQRNIIVVARGDLQEFQPIVINVGENGVQPTVFPTVKKCCFSGKQLISCHYSNNQLITVHLGSDRNSLLVDQLNNVSQFDDFSSPITTLFTYQLNSIPDWINFSPSGNLCLIRSINGAISVISSQSQQINQISSQMGNYVVFWAVPYDVLCGQEGEGQIQIYYSPLQSDVKCQQLQNDGTLIGSRITKPQQGVYPAEVSLIINSQGSETLIPLQTDTLTFTSLLQNKQTLAACLLLSKQPAGVVSKQQWEQLLELAYQERQFNIISRCLIAREQYDKANYANKVYKDISTKQIQFNSPQQQLFYEKAQISLLKDDLQNYEQMMIQAGKQQQAIDIYENLHLFNRAIGLCTEQQKIQMQQKQIEYYKDSKQYILAAQILCQQNQFNDAVTLLLQQKAFISAFNILKRIIDKIGNQALQVVNQQLIQQTAQQLEASGHQQLAGDLYSSPALNMQIQALNCYKSSKNFAKALELAKSCSPTDLQFIEGDYARYLQGMKQYQQAAIHFTNANQYQQAVECWLKCGELQKVDDLLVQTQFEYQTASQLKLQLAAQYFYKNQIKQALRWFLEADQPLLGVQACLSVGEYQEAIKVIKTKFQGSMQSEVIKSEAKRLMGQQQLVGGITISNGNPYGQISGQYQNNNAYGQMGQNYGQMGGQTTAQLATQILHKITTLSTNHGANASVQLFTAAEMYQDAVELLIGQQMYSELLNYVDKIEYANYSTIYQEVANRYQQQNNIRQCAQTLDRLAIKLNQAKQNIHPFIDQAVNFYIQLEMFEQAVNCSKLLECNDLLSTSLIMKYKLHQQQQQQIIEQIRAYNIVNQAAIQAVQLDCYDFAIKLSDFAPKPEDLKTQIYSTQGEKMEKQKQYQDADRNYKLANQPLKALQMWLSIFDFSTSENIVNNELVGQEKSKGARMLKMARAMHYLQQGDLQAAEKLFIELQEFKIIIAEYQQRSMWKEAIQVAKLSGDPELREKVIKGYQIQATAAENLQNSQKQDNQENQEEVFVIGAKQTYKQQVEQAIGKSDRQGLSIIVFTHLGQLCDKILKHQISQPDINEDEILIQPHIDLSQEANILVKTVRMIQFYLTKGCPAGSTKTIQLVVNSQVPIPAMISLAKVALSLQYTEDQWKGVMTQTAQETSIYSVVKQLIVNYKIRMTPQQQQQWIQPGGPYSQLIRLFEIIQLITHYSSLLMIKQVNFQLMKDLAAITSSMLRYVDLIPIDRAFYLAGYYSMQLSERLKNERGSQVQQFRQVFLSQSVIFYNTYLDIIDLGPNGDVSSLDLQVYKDCSITFALQKQPLVPETLFIQNNESIEQVRQYIMQMTLNSQQDYQLPTEKCPFSPGCQGMIWMGDIVCTTCNKTGKMCVLTGQHTTKKGGIQSDVACKNCGCHARQNQWNAWVERTNSCPVCGELGQKM